MMPTTGRLRPGPSGHGHSASSGPGLRERALTTSQKSQQRGRRPPCLKPEDRPAFIVPKLAPVLQKKYVEDDRAPAPITFGKIRKEGLRPPSERAMPPTSASSANGFSGI